MQIPKDAIEVNGYYTWMGDDGIGRTCVKSNIDITLKEALENTEAVTSLYRGKKFSLLIDSRQIKLMSYEARHHFSVGNRETMTCALVLS